MAAQQTLRVLLLTTLVACFVQSAFGGRHNYLGCFRDRKNPRSARDIGAIYTTNNSNSIQYCINDCRLRGYQFAGLQWTRECWCGNSYGRYGTADNCNSNCPTGGGKCGGSEANSVYYTGRRINVPGVARIVRASYISCFIDRSQRDLPFLVPASELARSTVQVGRCRNKCRSLNYKYAGLQYRQECWCSNTYGRYGTANNCNLNCRGNNSHICGGNWANSVYESGAVTSYTGIHTQLTSNYLGCFRDKKIPPSERMLGTNIKNDNAMTQFWCVSLCRNNNHRYAGVQFGRECWCGNSIGRHGRANNCNMRCRGNSSQFCGGSLANNVFDTQG